MKRKFTNGQMQRLWEQGYTTSEIATALNVSQAPVWHRLKRCGLKPNIKTWKGVKCKVDGCDRQVRCKGFCARHYSKLRIYGNAQIVKYPISVDTAWIQTEFAQPPWWTVRKVTSKMVDVFIGMANAGFSYKSIAGRCGVSTSTVYCWLHPGYRRPVDRSLFRKKSREEILDNQREYFRNRSHHDLVFREQQRKSRTKSRLKRYPREVGR